MASALSVLTRHRDFRRLFFAELVVFGADWFAVVPLVTLLLDLTGSGVWGSLALAADTGIGALLLPYAGAVADRWDRRRIMVLAGLGAIAGTALLFGVRGPGMAWLGPVGIAVIGAAKAFFSPAALAALPNVVHRDHLAAANVLSGSAWGTMVVLGSSAGGVMAGLIGPYLCFGAAAGLLVIASLLVWSIRAPLQGEPDSRPVPALVALREAVGYIRRHPRVASLVTVKAAVGIGNGVIGIFPMIAGLFGVGAYGTGALFAARGLGAVAGPLVMQRALSRSRWLMPGLALSMATYGVAYLAVAVSEWFVVTVLLVFLAHFAGGTNWVMSNYALQLEVPDRLRGRVFATDMMLATLAIAVSLLVVAAFIDAVDLRVLIGACGAVTLLYAVGWRWASRRHEPPADQPD